MQKDKQEGLVNLDISFADNKHKEDSLKAKNIIIESETHKIDEENLVNSNMSLRSNLDYKYAAIRKSALNPVKSSSSFDFNKLNERIDYK